MNLWHNVSPGDQAPDTVNVIVEIPKGSQNKFEYDKKNGIFKLDRVLFSPMHYPGDYGIIPQTLASDGDPLDALVLVNYPTYPGILLEAKPIGVLRMNDDGQEDDKILCVPTKDIRMTKTDDIADIPKPVLDEISHFFESYKKLEGKKVKILGWENSKYARLVITNSIDLYRKKMK